MEAGAARGAVEFREDIRRVMLAVDEHEGSFYALEWTLKNLHDSIIKFQPAREVRREVQEDQKKTAASLLENAREICIRHGITPEAITDVGDPKDAIQEEAVEGLNIQLLVVGSHGRGALKRAFLGSVSNYCVHNMKCPVLVVKKP
ncbi:universal stress protein A-like protein [Coffea arabica]|uniref:Universal stress protein A-like protein n=1 Tax=Coffea arabica TaxID=13443 RepID=A0A6P6V8L0_COFAR|nr:universal stress protein A-like protein [Coffea arabica]